MSAKEKRGPIAMVRKAGCMEKAVPLIVILSCGCAILQNESPEEAFGRVEALGTTSAYQQFLRDHRNSGQYSEQAKDEIWRRTLPNIYECAYAFTPTICAKSPDALDALWFVDSEAIDLNSDYRVSRTYKPRLRLQSFRPTVMVSLYVDKGEKLAELFGELGLSCPSKEETSEVTISRRGVRLLYSGLIYEDAIVVAEQHPFSGQWTVYPSSETGENSLVRYEFIELWPEGFPEAAYLVRLAEGGATIPSGPVAPGTSSFSSLFLRGRLMAFGLDRYTDLFERLPPTPGLRRVDTSALRKVLLRLHRLVPEEQWKSLVNSENKTLAQRAASVLKCLEEVHDQ